MTVPFDPARFTSPEEQEGWFAALARTIAVDFDGVLHPYTAGWVGSVPADEPPMSGARDFLRRLVEAGYRIVVFSTRCDHEEGLAGTRNWLLAHGLLGLIDDVTCQKPAAVAYVDDRAVPFRGSWADVEAGIAELAAGRPHGAAPAAVHAGRPPAGMVPPMSDQQQAGGEQPTEPTPTPDGGDTNVNVGEPQTGDVNVNTATAAPEPQTAEPATGDQNQQ